ncbi:MAG: glycosyltransferase family 4 protein [Candidatus Eisenbacteria bacterium]
MRILHLDLGREWRGGQQQVLYLTEGLTRRDHGSLVATPSASPLDERLLALGLPRHPLPVRAPRLPRSSLAVHRLLESERWDVIHAHTAHAHTVAAAALHLIPAPRPSFFVSRRVDFRPGRTPVDRLKYGVGDPHFLCVSDGVRRVMQEWGVAEDRLTVVHSGVELPAEVEMREDERRALRAELGVPPDRLLIGHIGQLVPHKGQKFLIEAASVLSRRGDAMPEPWHLALVGDGPLRAELISQIASLGLGDRITLAGHREGARRFLPVFDLYVSSSVEEGLGTSILDASAHRLAVVATTAGGSAETVRDGETGFLVPPADPRALADRIESLLCDPALRQRCGDAGRVFIAARFSRDAMVEGTLAAYQRELTL